MNEIVFGYFNPFGPPGKINVHEYKKWQSIWHDFKSLYAYGGPDGTMNFWIVYDGYIYYGNDKEQLESIRKKLKYRHLCEDL